MARVLIIEDERDIRELYKLVLEDSGHEVIGCFSEPRSAIASPPPGPRPDVIILDERLSGVSGTSFLDELRDRFPGVKILVATADPDAAATARARGADEAKEKPFPVAELAGIIDKMIGYPSTH